jgi:hypothetical protein
MTNEATFKNLDIKVANVNTDNPPWSKTDKRFHYTIQLTNNITKYSMIADYYSSVIDYNNGESELTNDELIEAAHMIIQDALCARDYTLEQFLEEFCYLESGQSALNAIKTYHQCKQLYDDLMKIFTPDQLEKLNEELFEWEYEDS